MAKWGAVNRQMAHPKPRAPLTAEQQPPPGARAIHLTKGWAAWVDEENYEALAAWSWAVQPGPPHHGPHYALRMAPGPRGERRPAVRMHLEVMGTSSLVDHRIHCETIRVVDNRKANLRLATESQNTRNARKIICHSSPYKGVSKTRRWWQARIRVDGRNLGLGCYSTPERAAVAYDEAALRYFGAFAWTNFPREMQA